MAVFVPRMMDMMMMAMTVMTMLEQPTELYRRQRNIWLRFRRRRYYSCFAVSTQ